MKHIILSVALASVCTLAAGCAAMNRVQDVSDAIHHGYVSGLSATNHFNTIIWSLPSVPSGPYSEITSLTATELGSATNKPVYVFLLGKSLRTKDWEVFCCTTWREDHWDYVPVTLPPALSK
jgi:hypothetical protein